MKGSQDVSDTKRPRDEARAFISPHHESTELSWEQERKLRVSCELRHLRCRHPDDLVLVLTKVLARGGRARSVVEEKLAEFTRRDDVDLTLANTLVDREQVAYAKRLGAGLQDLRWRYVGDLAQIIEHLVEQHVVDEEFVTSELQRINISQSDARKKLRRPGKKET